MSDEETLVAEAEPEIAEQVPADDPTDGSESAPPEDVPAEPEDHLVQCNTCGFVRRKSDEHGCPKGHTSGWSYAAPIPEPGTAVFIEPPDEPEEPKDDAHEKRSTGFEWALQQIIEVNQEAIEQKARVKEAQATLKDEKETLESIQDNLNRLIQEAAKLKTQGEPDPDKFPLFDRPKEPTAKDEVNALFPKPEAISPLPADTFEEHCRREARATRIDSLGLSPKIVEVLYDAGVETVDGWRRKREALEEASATVTTIKGLSEKRLEKLLDALDGAKDSWVASWNAAHPDQAVLSEDRRDVEEAERRLANEGDRAIPFEQAAEEIPDTPDTPTAPEPGDPPITDPNSPVGPALPAAVDQSREEPECPTTSSPPSRWRQ